LLVGFGDDDVKSDCSIEAENDQRIFSFKFGFSKERKNIIGNMNLEKKALSLKPNGLQLGLELERVKLDLMHMMDNFDGYIDLSGRFDDIKAELSKEHDLMSSEMSRVNTRFDMMENNINMKLKKIKEKAEVMNSVNELEMKLNTMESKFSSKKLEPKVQKLELNQDSSKLIDEVENKLDERFDKLEEMMKTNVNRCIEQQFNNNIMNQDKGKVTRKY